MSKREKQPEISERAERIEKAINYLTQKIEEIEKEGLLAEQGVKVARYIAKLRSCTSSNKNQNPAHLTTV